MSLTPAIAVFRQRMENSFTVARCITVPRPIPTAPAAPSATGKVVTAHAILPIVPVQALTLRVHIKTARLQTLQSRYITPVPVQQVKKHYGGKQTVAERMAEPGINYEKL